MIEIYHCVARSPRQVQADRLLTRRHWQNQTTRRHYSAPIEPFPVEVDLVGVEGMTLYGVIQVNAN